MLSTLTKQLVSSFRSIPHSQLISTDKKQFSSSPITNPQQVRSTCSPFGKSFKVSFFSAQPYDQRFFNSANERYGFTLDYHAEALDAKTVKFCERSDAVCAFVNDSLDAQVIEALYRQGTKAIALRCAGFNNVDIEAAKRFGLEVTRVPAYSPEAVAEHAIALLLTLNRRTHKAFNRVREGNFSLEGLLGMTLFGKTAGVIGMGRIGLATAKILHGFGCQVVGYDPYPNEEFKKFGKDVPLEELLKQSDIITLHCPLLPQTHYMINSDTLALMKKGSILINTSRGGLVNTMEVIKALKTNHLGGLGIDVYEQESGLFFRDCSSEIIEDDIFERLMTFPNVLVTGHQGFFTYEALHEIAEVTLGNLACFVNGTICTNVLVPRPETIGQKDKPPNKIIKGKI